MSEHGPARRRRVVGGVWVDRSTTPKAHHAVVFAGFGSEGLLVNEWTGRSLPVGQSGGVIWSLLDGSVSLGDLAADVAAVFAIRETEALSDLQELVGAAADEGLLSGLGLHALTGDPVFVEGHAGRWLDVRPNN